MAGTSSPDAPKYLPADVRAQWQATYDKAYGQAKLDSPDNERAQRIAALKTANAMLVVPPPKSAADIDALARWQLVKPAETRPINGVQMRVCVTADGRKYMFPVTAATAPATALSDMTKDQLVTHAQTNHGITLDPKTTKADMIATIQAAAGTAASN